MPVPPQKQVQQPKPSNKQADEFDHGFAKEVKSGIQVGKQIEHTFFGEKDQLNMLVSEQTQLEKMQAYNFQQFKQIQKMMVQMQKSQQWSFNNTQSQIEEVQKKLDDNHKQEMNYTKEIL